MTEPTTTHRRPRPQGFMMSLTADQGRYYSRKCQRAAQQAGVSLSAWCDAHDLHVSTLRRMEQGTRITSGAIDRINTAVRGRPGADSPSAVEADAEALRRYDPKVPPSIPPLDLQPWGEVVDGDLAAAEAVVTNGVPTFPPISASYARNVLQADAAFRRADLTPTGYLWMVPGPWLKTVLWVIAGLLMLGIVTNVASIWLLSR